MLLLTSVLTKFAFVAFRTPAFIGPVDFVSRVADATASILTLVIAARIGLLIILILVEAAPRRHLVPRRRRLQEVRQFVVDDHLLDAT